MPTLKQRFVFLLAALTSIAMVPAMHAADVSISGPEPWFCGHHSAACDGDRPYSLTELENGTVQLPVGPHEPGAFLILNDTGDVVRQLSLTYVGELAPESNFSCGLEDLAWLAFDKCSVTGTGRRGSGTNELFGPITSPVSMTFTSSNFQVGIPNGFAFEIRVNQFSRCDHSDGDSGYITGGNGGTTKPTGPPST